MTIRDYKQAAATLDRFCRDMRDVRLKRGDWTREDLLRELSRAWTNQFLRVAWMGSPSTGKTGGVLHHAEASGA